MDHWTSHQPWNPLFNPSGGYFSKVGLGRHYSPTSVAPAGQVRLNVIANALLRGGTRPGVSTDVPVLTPA